LLRSTPRTTGFVATGSGRHENLVRRDFADEIDRHVGIQSNFDPESVYLTLEPVEESLVRFVDARGESKRSAQLGSLLAEGDLVSSQRRAARSFESCWSAAAA